MRRSAILGAALAVACAGFDSAAGTRVAIIGGAKSEGAARHEYPDGVRLLRDLLAASPDARALDVAIDAYPDGWPGDPAALENVATVVWYFDGLERHPLRDAARRASFEAAMRRGIGLVALHQSFSANPGDHLGLDAALGGARIGMADRVTERVALSPSRTHEIARGVAAFAYHDEFFPTVRWTAGEGRVTPVLQAPGFTAAWAYERANGGRSFAYSGAHYLLALDEPGVVKTLLNAIFWTARLEVPANGVRADPGGAALRLVRRALAAVPDATASRASAVDTLTFHRDPQRTGWHAAEASLTPATVASASFGLLWESPPFEGADGESPRLYASPLYVDQVAVRGERRSIVVAASNAGRVYAINARASRNAAAGDILWQAALGAPCRLQPAPLDGVPTGVLATPVIDLARKRLYVTSCVAGRSWQAFALDLESGDVVRGWPVALDEATFNRVNRNAGPSLVPPARRHDFRVQRGALNLSPDGAFLYVTFGETETGWLVSIDAAAAKVASAFASVAMPHRGSGGLWGAGGAAVDAQGAVFVATGTGFDGYRDQPHDWTQSVLMLSHA
ncbi:MAG TPA: ThuA domain-containing protein, partial [Usitatibacter sp.]|nr:ThuA domain-containing protein [Usitatibacter sp.]